MSRVLLLAAAALLGSGCIVSNNDPTPTCPPSTITVTWNGFTRGDGAVLTCSQALVSGVDIFMNGQPVSTWNCTDGGATITQVQPGTYTLDVEGVESGGRIAFRDEFTVSTDGCGDHLVHAQPAEGYVDLNPNCVSGSLLWFSVFDEIANKETVRVDGSTTPVDFACGSTTANLFPLPAGPHRMQWLEEVVQQSPTSFLVTGAYCAPTEFTVQGGQTSTVNVSLANVPPAALCQ